MTECTHSLLKSPVERFIRDSVVYREFAYRVDREKSSLWAHIEEGRLWWLLTIQCVDTDYPDDDEDNFPPACAPSLSLTFPSSVRRTSWRAFEGTSYKFTFDDEEAFPLFPGIPSSAYIGYHHSCTEHHISFGRLLGSTYHVRWKPLARAALEHDGEFFFVDADVPFAGIGVRTSNGNEIESVEDTLTQWFNLDEFEAAASASYDIWYAAKVGDETE